MEAKELRIGNWINFGDPLNNLQINGTLIADFEERPHEFSYLSPISLNKEWLLKFGYYRDEFSYKEQDWQGKYHRISEFTSGVFTCDKTGVNIKSVHQLQNLYFALTGNELEIKPKK